MAESKTAWEQASDWFGRTIAIVLVMIAPGAAGAWLDGQLGTGLLSGLGFVLGMALAITLLLVFTRIKKIDNDGPWRSPATRNSTTPLTDSQSATDSLAATDSKPAVKPSESKLPQLPGAEVLEASSRDE